MEQMANYLQLKMLETKNDMDSMEIFTKFWFNKRAAYLAYKDAFSHICDDDILAIDWNE